MRPALATSVIAAVAALVAAVGGSGPRPAPRPSRPDSERTAGVAPLSVCPRGSLPDEGVCIPVPPPGGRLARGLRAAERIPRRPDRDASYSRYRLPVTAPSSVSEGAVPAPDGGVALWGIGLAARPGAPVIAVALEGQSGAASVVYAGPAWGGAVVTRHVVEIAGQRQEYLVLVGGLSSPLPLAPAEPLAPGTRIGVTGAAPLILETRLLRPSVDVRALEPAKLLDEASSVGIDPRNVLTSIP